MSRWGGGKQVCGMTCKPSDLIETEDRFVVLQGLGKRGEGGVAMGFFRR